MSLLVLKFGGTSVGDVERIKSAVGKVVAEAKAGHQLVVVVSAMSGQTDNFIKLCRAINPLHDMQEHDAVVATGENVTAGLMALAIQQRGLLARSFAGWQVPIVTDNTYGRARILDINPESLHACLAQGIVPVVAGYQGISEQGRVSTLGRGGSDTSAVALAAALKADRCDIYTDVDGVYTTDPRIVRQAHKMRHITYEEMLEMASLGAKVLQTRSVELAMNYRVPVQVLSTFDNAYGSELPGTLVSEEDPSMEQNVVTGIAYSKDEAKITLAAVPDKPGVAVSVFGPLADAGINVDMIVQNGSADGKATDMTFTVPRGDLARVTEILNSNKGKIGFTHIQSDDKVVKVSVIGVGMRSHAGVASTMFRTCAEKGINIQVISTSEIKISILIAEEYAELAIRSLHGVYGLDQKAA